MLLNVVVFGLSLSLTLIAPYYFFLTSNNYSKFSIEVLPLYLVALAIGVGVAGLIPLRLPNIARFILWVFLNFAIALLYDLSSIPEVAILGLISAILILVLRDNAAMVIFVAASMHIGSTLGLDMLNHFNRFQDVSTIQISRENDENLQPVLHLVLDEYAGIRGIPTELPTGRDMTTQLVEYYSAQGFDLYSHAFSQYIDTTDSISNLVNFASSSKNQEYTEGAGDLFELTRNEYFDHLIDVGYSLHLYQSTYLDFCNTLGIIVQSCTSYESNSIAAIEDVDIASAQKARFILNSFVDSSEFLLKLRQAYLMFSEWAGVSLPSWPTGNSRTGPLSVLPVIAKLQTALYNIGPGEVHFAHLMLPHYPYNLDADCNVKPRVATWLNRTPFEVFGKSGPQNSTDSRKERYVQYFSQLACTQKIINELFEAIRASGYWENTVIIIHGDHGSRIVRHFPSQYYENDFLEDDFRDAYSTLFAVKNNASIGRLETSPLALQTLLARVWSLPAPRLEPLTVFIQVPDQTELIPTSLQGFYPFQHGSPQDESQ